MISRAEKRELRRIARRGTAPQAGENLIRQGLVKPAHTTPDGQGGYTVDCYAVSEKGIDYLASAKKERRARTISILKAAGGVIGCLLAVAEFLLMLSGFPNSGGAQ